MMFKPKDKVKFHSKYVVGGDIEGYLTEDVFPQIEKHIRHGFASIGEEYYKEWAVVTHVEKIGGDHIYMVKFPHNNGADKGHTTLGFYGYQLELVEAYVEPSTDPNDYF